MPRLGLLSSDTGMTLSESSLSALAASPDIISIGAAADDRRRALHARQL